MSVLLYLLLLYAAATLGQPVESVELTVYPDGSVAVEMVFRTSQEEATVNLTLLGEGFEDLVVINEEGLPLDYRLIGVKLEVDTLGSNLTVVYYVTQSLTNKTGPYWVLAYESPVRSKVLMPIGSTVLSLNAIPENVYTVEERTVLVMPAGRVEVSYTLTLPPMETAIALIAEARAEVKKAEDEERTLGLEEAKEMLSKAEEAFERGEYKLASSLAKEAIVLAKSASKPPAPKPPLVSMELVVAIMVLAVVVAVIAILKARGRGSRVERLLRENPDLREEDRRALRLIAEKGGVYESELSRRLGLPRTTTWRLIRRLEARGLVIVRKEAGRNLIVLR